MPLPTPIVVGNWKMHGLQCDAQSTARALAERLNREPRGGTLAVCPPFTLLFPLDAVLAGTDVLLGAQDCHEEDKGAFTGEVAAPMLADAGCALVIVGHSERRHGLGETDARVRAKAGAVLKAGLMPLVCVGETEEEYLAGRTLDVLTTQLEGSLPEAPAGKPLADRLMVAYEPVWAIGTGRTPSSEEIARAHDHMATTLERLGLKGVPLLYGGSVKPDNAGAILAVDHVDGVLVGGASLKADDFWGIYAAGA